MSKRQPRYDAIDRTDLSAFGYLVVSANYFSHRLGTDLRHRHG